jgi:tetratricopeptide (TPR) repeat protein
MNVELKVRIYGKLERPDEELRAIQEGAEAAPHSWLILMLLGTAYTRLGRFRESLDVFERALRAEHGVIPQIDFNYAVALGMAGLRAQAQAQAGLDGIVVSKALKREKATLVQSIREERALYRRKWFGLFG